VTVNVFAPLAGVAEAVLYSNGTAEVIPTAVGLMLAGEAAPSTFTNLHATLLPEATVRVFETAAPFCARTSLAASVAS